MWDKFLLYFHTLKHLRFIQIKYRVFYILRAKWRKIVGFSYDFKPTTPKSEHLKFLPSLFAYTSYRANDDFHILNLRKQFSNNKIDWNYPAFGKLWTYNLNYFEYLHQNNFDKKEGIRLIDNYVESIEQIKDGLEPFPISLRSIFWIRFFVEHSINNEKFDQCLYAQLKILLHHCEYHLMGNHLLENGFGLLFGAYYFNDNSFYQKAKSILQEELKEQILGDGAHFELSPMYHQLMLYRVLDSINLVENNAHLFNAELLPFLREKAKVMLGWLKQISWKDGEIPHLNDSTNGVAPKTLDLTKYAAKLNIQPTNTSLSDSGYRKYYNENVEAIIDVGRIGPNYIPGHAHSDSLNIVLRVRSVDLIVDTSISTYEKNNLRYSERCTKAHNTVQINDLDQTQVWGGFRVAYRANTNIHEEAKNNIKVSHDGYKNCGVIHTRSLDLRLNEINIIDSLNDNSEGIAIFHFNPDLVIQVKENQIKTEFATLTFKGHESLQINDFQLALSFNKRIVGKVLEVKFNKQLNTTIALV